ncbi:MAG: hypothetical protein R3327_04200 [Nitrosopumilaceae archaeon]|nr:hypothetical protein [Nitrosopumilaceae archaeon]
MDDDLTEALDECLRILDENVDVLSDIEMDLEEEKEDQIQPDMQLHNLYDMAEDVSTLSKLRAAEARFMRRQSED